MVEALGLWMQSAPPRLAHRWSMDQAAAQDHALPSQRYQRPFSIASSSDSAEAHVGHHPSGSVSSFHSPGSSYDDLFADDLLATGAPPSARVWSQPLVQHQGGHTQAGLSACSHIAGFSDAPVPTDVIRSTSTN